MRSRGVAADRLLILADDLTGALDTACEFAASENPVAVSWIDAVTAFRKATVGKAPARRQSISLETREMRAAAASRTVAATVAGLPSRPQPTLAFKKIDSVLRGSPAKEIGVWLEFGAFDGAVVAPAFPEQGRRTQGGRQFALAPDRRWHAVGPPLVAALRRRGINAFVGNHLPAATSGRACFAIVVDAETQAQLNARVASLASQARESGRRILWCGTGGLAHALAPRHPAEPAPTISLIVAGTRHHKTLEQVARAAGVVRTQVLDGRPLPPPDDDLLLLVADPNATGAHDAMTRMRASLRSLREWPPRNTLVTGGQTLQMLCELLGADALTCHGRLSAGLSLARFDGGFWNGRTAIGKSGGFGTPDLFRDLLGAN